jgi:hypothetical protein
VQGGYVSSSQGTQLNVTKKSNVLDKGKPNILNSAAKKLQNHSNDQSNNNSTDISDSAPIKQEREPSPVLAPPPAPVVPEVTVSKNKISLHLCHYLSTLSFFLLASRYQTNSRRDSKT